MLNHFGERGSIGPGQQNDGPMTIPLPEEAIPVGHTWSELYDVDVPLDEGGVKRVKTRQTFKLVSVKTGVATIELATNVLTPNLPPAVTSGHRDCSTGAGKERVIGFEPTTFTLVSPRPQIASSAATAACGAREFTSHRRLHR